MFLLFLKGDNQECFYPKVVWFVGFIFETLREGFFHERRGES